MAPPGQLNLYNPVGSQWAGTFQLLTAPGGPPQDITGKTFEFVIRPHENDTAPVPVVKVTATPTSQGYLTVDTVTATVQVVLTAAAAALLGNNSWPYALWQNPGGADQKCILAGRFASTPVAAA